MEFTKEMTERLGVDPRPGVSVILVPDELAAKILVLGEIISRRQS